MDKDFFHFIIEPEREGFLKSRDYVIGHDKYDPYSDDLAAIDALLEKEKYQEAIEYNNINTLLSPRTHLMKSFAFKKLQREKEAQSELILAHRILECIELTGNGSKEDPYIVTRVEDERDFLMYLEEGLSSQELLRDGERHLDLISTVSGKKIHFDITDCYKKLSEKMQPKKKWWSF